MTSGSLFSRDGHGYSGGIDDVRPDALSESATNSAVFRLNSRKHSFKDIAVDMRVRVDRLAATPTTPAKSWDGIHIWMRYQSQHNIYVASIIRRDGHVAIKKKCPGGPSNDGTYYTLGDELANARVPLDRWVAARVTATDISGGRVRLTLDTDRRRILSATDSGLGCPPIRAPGAVGIRGDNAEFQFKEFTVTRR